MMGQFFQLNNIRYQLHIASNISSPSLQVALLPSVERSTPKLKTISSAFESYGIGRFKSIDFLFPLSLPIDMSALSAHIAGIYSSGYSWLFEYVKKKMREYENEVSMDLYAFIRSLLRPHCKDEMLNSLLLGMDSSEGAHYILDTLTMNSILQNFSKTNISPPASFARLFSELLKGQIDYKKSFAKIAVERGDCYDFDLSKSAYFQENALFQFAEEANYLGRPFSLFPLHVSDEPYLIAVFPTSFKMTLLPLLKQIVPDVSTYYVEHRKKIKKAFKRFQALLSSEFEWGKIGEFWGGFFKAWASST